jgi:hypothetical protein
VSGPTESAELDRSAFFSNGVFAIAIRLLVVPLLDHVTEVSSGAVFVLLLLHERWYCSPAGAFV